MKMNLPEDVNFIIHKLYENGFEAYAVGGCGKGTEGLGYYHIC